MKTTASFQHADHTRKLGLVPLVCLTDHWSVYYSYSMSAAASLAYLLRRSRPHAAAGALLSAVLIGAGLAMAARGFIRQRHVMNLRHRAIHERSRCQACDGANQGLQDDRPVRGTSPES